MIQHFVLEVCGVKPEWTPQSIIEEAVDRVRRQVGRERVLAAVSGGVDSSVAAALVHEAVGDQLVAVFVDTGLLRKNEGAQVASAFRDNLHSELITVDADDPLSRVADLCIVHRVRRVLVLQRGRLVGVIARRDVLRALVESQVAIHVA